MIIPLLSALAALFSLAKVMIEKFVPGKITKKKEFKHKQMAVNQVDRWRLLTHQQIAALKNREVIHG